MSDKTVPLPEGGEGCRLSFDVQAMEHLCAELGDHYVSHILDGLDRHDISTFKMALKAMARDMTATPEDVINSSVMAELALKIANAMSLRLYGKTFEEHQQAAVSAALAAAKSDAA